MFGKTVLDSKFQALEQALLGPGIFSRNSTPHRFSSSGVSQGKQMHLML